MAHDVFISYASADKAIADAVCAAIEKEKIRCWVAPRDIQPGQEWPNAIVNAISSSKIMVLVFSSNSNNSPQVRKELSLAVNTEVIVIPLKIENIPLDGSMQYFLADTHWLDAMNPPSEKQIKKLVRTVQAVVQNKKTDKSLAYSRLDQPEHGDLPSEVVHETRESKQEPDLSPDQIEKASDKQSVLGLEDHAKEKDAAVPVDRAEVYVEYLNKPPVEKDIPALPIKRMLPGWVMAAIGLVLITGLIIIGLRLFDPGTSDEVPQVAETDGSDENGDNLAVSGDENGTDSEGEDINGNESAFIKPIDRGFFYDDFSTDLYWQYDGRIIINRDTENEWLEWLFEKEQNGCVLREVNRMESPLFMAFSFNIQAWGDAEEVLIGLTESRNKCRLDNFIYPCGIFVRILQDPQDENALSVFATIKDLPVYTANHSWTDQDTYIDLPGNEQWYDVFLFVNGQNWKITVKDGGGNTLGALEGIMPANHSFYENVMLFRENSKAQQNMSGFIDNVVLKEVDSEDQALASRNRDLVFIPSGIFMMGSSEEIIESTQMDCNNYEVDCSEINFEDQAPDHFIFLESYWIDRCEVTNAMYAEFLASQGNRIDHSTKWVDTSLDYVYLSDENDVWRPEEGFEEYPVAGVTWYGAQAYCDWVGMRLPAEAEWEKAARGNSDNQFPWGDFWITGELANYCDENCEEVWSEPGDDGFAGLSPVGIYPEGISPYGVLDMAGNVSEWVYDWYDADYYQYSPETSPAGPLSGSFRSYRGGSYQDIPLLLFTAKRGFLEPEQAASFLGFRCVFP